MIAGDVDGLPPASRAVAEVFLDEREGERRHLVIALTGAHAYGFPSVDSDLDLKGVHVEATRRLLGLSAPPPSHTKMETREGVELDYTSNELGQVLAGLLSGSGSYLERILGRFNLRETPALARLQELARASLSKKYLKHYAGFSCGQRREYEAQAAPTAKKLLYVIRTALTGAWLVEHGELVTDLGVLAPRYGLEVDGLIAHKRQEERGPLDAATVARWAGELDRVQAFLDAAAARSPLPEEPDDGVRRAMHEWLIETRLAAL
jgi:predicted nucleotidyltransferase